MKRLRKVKIGLRQKMPQPVYFHARSVPVMFCSHFHANKVSLTPIQDGTAIVGDASKFISGKAVLDAGRDFVRLREGGLFRMYSEHEIEGFEDREGKKLPFCKDNGLYTVDTAGTCEIYWKRTGIPYAG